VRAKKGSKISDWEKGKAFSWQAKDLLKWGSGQKCKLNIGPQTSPKNSPSSFSLRGERTNLAL